MAELCKFPGCTRWLTTKGGFCVSHAKYFGGTTIKEETPKPIAKKSSKRIEEDKVYKKAISDLRKISDKCEIKSPVCTGKMQGGHHVQKTSPKNRNDKSNIKRSCNACNLSSEMHPGWAEEKGHSKSRFKNVLSK